MHRRGELLLRILDILLLDWYLSFLNDHEHILKTTPICTFDYSLVEQADLHHACLSQ